MKENNCIEISGIIFMALIISGLFCGVGTAQAGERVSSALPPSIMPIIFLKGSDYQMGYQYGRQAGKYIVLQKDGVWVDCIDQLGSREKVVKQIKGMEYYIKKYTPDLIQQMKGIADGATAAGFKVTYDDILLINCGVKNLSPNVTPPAIAKADEFSPEGCSVFSAWGSATKDGKMIFGDTKDSDFDYQVVIVAFPDKGNNFIAGLRAGELAEHFSMNNKGLFIGTGQNAGNRDVDNGYGLKKQFGIQHMLRFAKNAVEAKDMFLSWEFPNNTNLIFSDVGGNAFVVERTTAVKGVRKVGDFGERDFIYSTNNSMTQDMKEAAKGKTYIDHAGWLIKGGAVPRGLEAWNMFHNYHGKIDQEFMKMILRFPGNPPPHPSKKDFKEERDQTICNFQNIRVAYGMPDNGDKGVVYVCTGPAGKLLNPPSLRRRPCYQIDGTYSFYRLTLPADPARVVQDARETAFDYLAEAYQEFMLLNYSDNRYAPSKKIYSEAVAEYYKGINAENKALLAGGNNAILLLSDAATEFTRSQAHAKQIYEALKPPPTRPEDLGLQPYGGAWGKWATQ
jgi:hypothetical protein